MSQRTLIYSIQRTQFLIIQIVKNNHIIGLKPTLISIHMR